MLVGVILWVLDTRAQSLLIADSSSSSSGSTKHAVQRAVRRQSELLLAKLLTGQQQHQQQQCLQELGGGGHIELCEVQSFGSSSGSSSGSDSDGDVAADLECHAVVSTAAAAAAALKHGQQQVQHDTALQLGHGVYCSQPERDKQRHAGSTRMLKWLGVKAGKEKKALKKLSKSC